jgi:hypothetical protein
MSYLYHFQNRRNALSSKYATSSKQKMAYSQRRAHPDSQPGSALQDLRNGHAKHLAQQVGEIGHLPLRGGLCH